VPPPLPEVKTSDRKQGCGSGSGRIGSILPDLDLHPGPADPDPKPDLDLYPFKTNVKINYPGMLFPADPDLDLYPFQPNVKIYNTFFSVSLHMLSKMLIL
jgi:hypothetical protein